VTVVDPTLFDESIERHVEDSEVLLNVGEEAIHEIDFDDCVI